MITLDGQWLLLSLFWVLFHIFLSFLSAHITVVLDMQHQMTDDFGHVTLFTGITYSESFVKFGH